MIVGKFSSLIVTTILGIAALWGEMVREITERRLILIPGEPDETKRRVLTKRGHLTLRCMIFSAVCGLVAMAGDWSIQDKKNKEAEIKTNQIQGKLTSVTNAMTDLRINFEAETNAMGNLQKEYDELLHIFAVNTSIPRDYRVATLDAAFLRASNDEVAHQSGLHLLDLQQPDLKTIREKRDHELAIQEDLRREQAVEQEKEKMKSDELVEQQNKEAEINKQGQALADRLLLKFEGFTSKDEFLPLFDSVIVGLDRILSKNSGQKAEHNFQGATPSAYSADFLTNDGRLCNGTNTISVGESTAWKFTITVKVKELHASPASPQMIMQDDKFFHSISIYPGDTYATLRVESKTTNGVSELTVTPIRNDWNIDSGPERLPTEPFPINFYPQVAVKLNVPNGLNIDKVVPLSDYTNVINDALSKLIGAQDEQVPLITYPSHAQAPKP